MELRYWLGMRRSAERASRRHRDPDLPNRVVTLTDTERAVYGSLDRLEPSGVSAEISDLGPIIVVCARPNRSFRPC